MRKALLLLAVIIVFGSILLATDAFGLSESFVHRGGLQFHSEPTFLVLFGAGLMLAGNLLSPSLVRHTDGPLSVRPEGTRTSHLWQSKKTNA
jgi:hypothetical protein